MVQRSRLHRIPKIRDSIGRLKKLYVNAKEPKVLSIKGGRCWEQVQVVLPDGKLTEGVYDHTWGYYAYFFMNGKWYKTELTNAENGRIDLHKLSKRV